MLSSAQIWDTRQRSCSHEFNVHEDYISDMTVASDSMKLVATRFKILYLFDSLKLVFFFLNFHGRLFSLFILF